MDQKLKVNNSLRQGVQETHASIYAMTNVYNCAVEQNPSLTNATVIDTVDAVQSQLWHYNIMTTLDSHVSIANWGCDFSRYFDTGNRQQNLNTAVEWSVDRFSAVAMGLHDEMHGDITEPLSAGDAWHSNVVAADDLVYAANENVMVIASGDNGDTDSSTVSCHNMIGTSGWPWKHVWEAHSYIYPTTYPDSGSCESQRTEYDGLFGFLQEDTTGLLLLSEFDADIKGGLHDSVQDSENAHLMGYLIDNNLDLTLWALQGFGEVQDDKADMNEIWGVLDNS